MGVREEETKDTKENEREAKDYYICLEKTFQKASVSLFIRKQETVFTRAYCFSTWASQNRDSRSLFMCTDTFVPVSESIGSEVGNGSTLHGSCTLKGEESS